MQSAATSPSSVRHLPVPGVNKLQQALNDYDLMVTELANTKDQLREQTELANRVVAENEAIKNQMRMQVEFLTRNLDMITAHRDRLQTTLKGLMTRFKVIRECFLNAEREALEEGLKLIDETPEKTKADEAADEQALKDLALHDNERRQTPMPSHRYQP